MTTGINKLAIIGTIVAALVVAGPASAKIALPDGYAPPSAEPSGYSPQALKALGERSQAMATFYSQSAGYSPQVFSLGTALAEYAQFNSQSTGLSPQALEEPRQHWQAMMGDLNTSVPDVFERAALRHEDGGVVGDVGRTSPDVIQQPNRASIAIDSVGRSSDGSGTGNSQVVADDSFDWNTFGIAAGTGVLLVALLGAGLIGLRARGRVAHP
jgi:hypothetical protein